MNLALMILKQNTLSLYNLFSPTLAPESPDSGAINFTIIVALYTHCKSSLAATCSKGEKMNLKDKKTKPYSLYDISSPAHKLLIVMITHSVPSAMISQVRRFSLFDLFNLTSITLILDPGVYTSLSSDCLGVKVNIF